MSHLDELIAELCPDGVEFQQLGEVCEVLSGYAFRSELFNTDAIGMPLIRIRDVNTGYSETYYSGEYDERYIVNPGDVIIGMDGDFRAVRWRHGQALLNQRVCRLQRFSGAMSSGFLFYKVKDELNRIQEATQGSTVKHLSSRELERSRVPVPPLEVQREIVRILDAFTELEARRHQYEHYRDALLTDSTSSAPRSKLGELGKFIRGKRFTKADYDPAGVGCIHYGEIYTHFGTSATNVVSHVRAGLAPALRYALPGDLVIVDVGETVEDVGKAVAWLGDEPVAIHDHSYAYRHSLHPVYASHMMQSQWFRREKLKYIARTKVNTLLIEGFSRIEIPVPPLDEQERIADTLDKFDALVNDLSVGLPAELAARRKQYEYYRDKLLTFKELPA